MDADPICDICNKAVREMDEKTTIQDVLYHTRCWDRRQAHRPPPS